MRALYLKECGCCNKQFESPYLRAEFCSKSCANKARPRRKKKISICDYELCNNPVEFYTHRFCKECQSIGRHFMSKRGGKTYSEMTIKDFAIRKGANRFDAIRGAARKVFPDIKSRCCEECGWSRHVEVCHIKSISSFPEDTTIDKVNDPSNLKLLCPNCHWLFDHPEN